MRGVEASLWAAMRLPRAFDTLSDETEDEARKGKPSTLDDRGERQERPTGLRRGARENAVNVGANGVLRPTAGRSRKHRVNGKVGNA